MFKYRKVRFFWDTDRQVATVAMATTQLILSSQFKKSFNLFNWELNNVSLCQKIISKHCELVKLCDINRSGPVFLRHTVVTKEITFNSYNYGSNLHKQYVVPVPLLDTE